MPECTKAYLQPSRILTFSGEGPLDSLLSGEEVWEGAETGERGWEGESGREGVEGWGRKGEGAWEERER